MQETKFKLGSLFSGIGGFEYCAQLYDIEPVWASEVEPSCIRITSKHFPEMKHLGDITKINGAEIEPVDVITGGSPCQDMSVAGKVAGIKYVCESCGEHYDISTDIHTCPKCGAEINLTRSGLFMEQIRIIKEMRKSTNGCCPKFGIWENVCFVAGTLITCENGYKSIEDISVGDKVKTLSGNYFPVVKTHKIRKQPVILLKISGGEDLTVTENHPFYARLKHYTNSNSYNGRIVDPPKWTKAGELTENHLIGYRLDTPNLPDNFITEDEAWAIGRWLADGSLDLKRGNPRIFISVGNNKIDDTREHLNKLPYNIHENRVHATAINFTFTSREFYSLISDANTGAGYKRVPNYVFSLPHNLQKVVLDGYISGDGYIRNRGNGIELSASTASRELAYGIARLIRNSYHVSANISRKEPKNSCIDGREIKANFPSYQITASITNKVSQSIFEDDIVWQPVKSIEKLEKHEDVYNISVLEDNTYEANGVISHNCGAFSSNNGDDFNCVLKEFCGLLEEKLPTLRPERWSTAGEILGKSGSIAWRVLDAQYWGVPQRRRRIFLVVDFGGQRASEILFKPESLRRYSTPSKAPWKITSSKVETSIGAANSDAECKPICVAAQQTNAENMLGKSPTLTEANGTSGSDRPYVVSHDDRPINSEPIAFEPGAASRLGGHVWTDGKCGTITSHMGDNQMSVVTEHSTVYGLCSLSSNSMKSDNPDSGCYEATISKTLDTNGLNPACNQGGNVVVSEPVYCLQGNGIDRADTAGCNGKGWKENICYTLNTVDRPAVAYSVNDEDTEQQDERTVAAFLGGNGEKARSIGYSESVSPTLKGGNPPTVMCPIQEDKPYVAAFAHQAGSKLPMMPYNEELSPTLNSHQTMAVLIESNPTDARFKISDNNICQTITSRFGTGGNQVPLVLQSNDINPKYIVRRLTPLECERLQGYPEVMELNTDITKDEFIAYNLACRNIIVDFETGNIYSTRGPGGIRLSTPKKLNGTIVNGYKVCSIRTDGMKKQCRFNRIVWIAAHGIPDIGLVVDHINNDKQDNRLCNLQLLTPKENSTKAAKDGLYLSGENHPGIKISKWVTAQICEEYANGDVTMRELAKKYRISKSRIQQIVRSNGWTGGESDANRYKALGNSVALPCVDYIMSGIREALDPKS